jgi:hypothetical protein
MDTEAYVEKLLHSFFQFIHVAFSTSLTVDISFYFSHKYRAREQR